jgi:hypothetical protein
LAKGFAGPLKTGATVRVIPGSVQTPWAESWQIWPSHPANTEPLTVPVVDGVSITDVSAGKLNEQVPVGKPEPEYVQLIPAGVLVIVPLPLPAGFTVTVKLGGGGPATKLAPIDSDCVMVNEQKPVVSVPHFDASGAFPTFQL